MKAAVYNPSKQNDKSKPNPNPKRESHRKETIINKAEEKRG